MKREAWKKVYAPQDNMLDLRVKSVLASLCEEPERSMSMKKVFVLAMVAMMVLASAIALAAGVVFSAGVDAVQLADRALYEKYGITEAMHTYFSRNMQEKEDGSAVITYTGFSDFAYVLGTYTVLVENGKAEATWSRDGESTEGGLESPAWGAEQLEIALTVNRETHGFGEVYDMAVAHAQAAGEKKWEAPEAQENLPPEGYQSWAHYYRAQALPRMAIAPKDALEQAKAAIVERYALTTAQAERMEWHDTWTDFGMVGDTPVLEVWFSLWMEPDGLWTQGDGLYGAFVNVETGVIESMIYDSALAGNG